MQVDILFPINAEAFAYHIPEDRLVNPVKRDEIGKLFLTLKSSQINPVIEHFKGTVSYEEAKIVRAYMRRKTG